MRYKLLGRAGLRVSELCLGTMTFGTEWGYGSDRETSQGLFDAFANAGGTFLDTANRYTEGTSERYLGEFIAADRDHFVVATKYSLRDAGNDPALCGNHRKNLWRSVRASLERLDTDHIDLLWVHAWDGMTGVDELMRGLDDLVSQGVVHYIGISDTPAWVVSRCQMLADLRGWTAFAALQLEYSLVARTPERDLLPMARALDLAVTPWGALGGGALTGKYLKGGTGRVPEHSQRRSERSQAIATAVVDVADELGAQPGAVALAWLRAQGPQILPIVGARNAEQLTASLACLEVTLSPDHLTRLDEVSRIELGFPHDFLRQAVVADVLYGNTLEKTDLHRPLAL